MHNMKSMNNIYDAEFHPLIHSPVNHLSWRKWIKFFLYVAMMTCMIGFMVTDLVYGCSMNPCIGNAKDPIPMSLAAWFQFSGMIGGLILVFAISFGCCWTIPRDINLILNMIPQIIMFSWILIGNVVYWKNYYRNNDCEKGIITYLMIRFYLGFVIIFISVYHEIKLHDQ